MTLFIEFHVYIYIVYAYFFISPFRNCMYFRFTNHSGRCDWDVCFIRNDLTYTKVISGQYQIKWVMFIALFFCGFSDISLPCFSLTTITLCFLEFTTTSQDIQNFFSFFLSLNNYLCMFTYRYILPSFETASQFQSWRLLVVTRCVQFRTGALTSHPFH